MMTVTKSESEWQTMLSQEQFFVLRKHGTERPFSSPLNDVSEDGVFVCAGCQNKLFSKKAKFDSGTGWPSFFEPISDNAVSEFEDKSLFMKRTEIRCSNCDGHLGHVFNDGPNPTGCDTV